MKKVVVLSIVLVLVCFFAGCRGHKAVYIVQISDTQLGFIDDNRSMTGEVELFTSAIDKINSLQPEAIVITGDFVNSSRNREQTDKFKELCTLISSSIPVYKIPGNHDLGNSRDSLNRSYYQSLYGSDRFSVVIQGVSLIGINTCLIKDSVMALKEQQFQWLAQELGKAGTEKYRLVFGHHPFFMSDIQEAENYSNLPLKERLRYDSLFQASNVSCYVAGHLHDNADARHGDVQYITTSALGRQLGKAQAGVRILRIDSEGVSQCYVAVPDLPSTSEALEQLFNSQFNN